MHFDSLWLKLKENTFVKSRKSLLCFDMTTTLVCFVYQDIVYKGFGRNMKKAKYKLVLEIKILSLDKYLSIMEFIAVYSFQELIRDLLFLMCYLFTIASVRLVMRLFITVVNWNTVSVLVIILFTLTIYLLAKLFQLRRSG